MANAQAHVLISGRVQGVSFRYYTYHEALRLGLSGWVRNLNDGRVEASFEGAKAAVEQMIAWCQVGPPASSVDKVEVNWGEASGEFQSFGVRGTGSLAGG